MSATVETASTGEADTVAAMVKVAGLGIGVSAPLATVVTIMSATVETASTGEAAATSATKEVAGLSLRLWLSAGQREQDGHDGANDDLRQEGYHIMAVQSNFTEAHAYSKGRN
ncbi:uncharacterized protein LOC123510173 [Portunus trituberculatus]|uniref:uncharacterized protein LOC123510173 n=1 Tax=Portunus trituberculatus TaxID=210409 RepID=UPI001E1D0BB2|nr:uncharacterized protein LOC123510173 [Portunus trituberculatus]